MKLSAVSSGHRMRLRKSLAVAGVTALTGVGIVVGATPAFAGSCGQIFNPSTGGGYAHWTLGCSGGRIYMDGYVVDTRADGQCAQVQGQFSNATYYSARACPSGTRRDFHWNGPGMIANGYLFFS